MALPDFIIIGAAKAGTTAMYWYLAEHPEVHMSEVKETNYFAYEVDENGKLLYGVPELHHFPVHSAHAYENLFEKPRQEKVAGEASPMYLECPRSAARIHAAIPGARLICGLRNPVDRAYSDYLMYLRGVGEPFIPERDLSTDADWVRPDSHWMKVSRYHGLLKRYYDLFPREQIQVFLVDDLKANAVATVQSIYAFIGVNPAYEPDVDTPYNVGGVPASPMLERVFTTGAAVRHAVEPWVPKPALKWLRRVRASNMEKPPPLPADLREMLMDRFANDIRQTSALTGRDLDHWLSVDESVASPYPLPGIAPGERRAI